MINSKNMVPKKLFEIFTSKQPKILIIDDHLEVSIAQEKVILHKYQNAAVTVATSFENASQLIEQNDYDIVLLDNSLMKWSDSLGRLGTTFIPLIKEKKSDTFILFISMNKQVSEILLKRGDVHHAVPKELFWEFFRDLEKAEA